MTTIKAHLSNIELETRYEAAADPVAKSHFHALWLLSCGYEVEEVAEILSFSPRWVRALIKRYNEGGAEVLGDQCIHNGTKPTILTPEALAALKQRIKMPPDDGGLWTGPKIARWLAKFHGFQSVHDQLFDPAAAATPSITAFGFLVPILIDESGVVVAGHDADPAVGSSLVSVTAFGLTTTATMLGPDW